MCTQTNMANHFKKKNNGIVVGERAIKRACKIVKKETFILHQDDNRLVAGEYMCDDSNLNLDSRAIINCEYRKGPHGKCDSPNNYCSLRTEVTDSDADEYPEVVRRREE